MSNERELDQVWSRLDKLDEKVDKIGDNVVLLLQARAIEKEQKKLIAKIAAGVATVVTLTITVMKFVLGIH